MNQLSDVKTWTVTADHKARPKNPFIYENDIVKDMIECERFEQFAQQNTFACDESLLPGDYPSEIFCEPIWQYLNESFGGIWVDMNYNPIDINDNRYRQYLPLKSEHTPVKQESKKHHEAKQFTFDQKDTVMGWARDRGSRYLQSMYPKFGPNKEPILCIRHEQDAPIEVHINDWIMLTDKGLIACTRAAYEANYKAYKIDHEIVAENPIIPKPVKQESDNNGWISVIDFLNRSFNGYTPINVALQELADGVINENECREVIANAYANLPSPPTNL